MKQKTKVAIDCTVLAFNKEGIGQYLIGILSGLNNIPNLGNIEFSAIFESGTNVDLINKVDQSKIQVEYVKSASGILSGTKRAWKVANYARKNNFDYLISTHSHVVSLFFKNTIYLIHDIGPIIHPEYFRATDSDSLITKFREKIFRFMFRWGVHKTKYFLTTSEFVKSELVTHYQIPESKITAIGSGPGNIVKDKNSQSPILNDLQLIQGKYFLNINTLSPRKNIETLIAGFVEFLINSDDKEFKLVIVGKKGWNYDSIFDLNEKLSEENPQLNLTECIIFTGYIDSESINKLIDEAAALVYPSFYEGFGLPPLEASLKLKEIILSDIPVFRELFNLNAHFFEKSDPISLAKQLSAVVNGNKKTTPEVVQKLNDRYNWQKVCDNLIEVIKKL